MKAVVAAFNQEKALVGAFSVITILRMELFQALVVTCAALAAGPVPVCPRQPSGPLPLPQDDQHGRPGALELPVGAAAGQQLQTRGSVSRP